MVLILPIQEHGRYFHLLRYSLISFFRVLKFLSCGSYTDSPWLSREYLPVLFFLIYEGGLWNFLPLVWHGDIIYGFLIIYNTSINYKTEASIYSYNFYATLIYVTLKKGLGMLVKEVPKCWAHSCTYASAMICSGLRLCVRTLGSQVTACSK